MSSEYLLSGEHVIRIRGQLVQVRTVLIATEVLARSCKNQSSSQPKGCKRGSSSTRTIGQGQGLEKAPFDHTTGKHSRPRKQPDKTLTHGTRARKVHADTQTYHVE